MNVVENQTFDEERAFYGQEELRLKNCSFDGPADGESAIKECRDVQALNCYYNLRYPFWHVSNLVIEGGVMTDKCRAALWYTDHARIDGLTMSGIKALRECDTVTLHNCDVESPEFGWNCNSVVMQDVSVKSEYFMMNSSKLKFEGVKLNGKYSFQYVKGAIIDNCNFNTKDAFWHSENVTVKNSVIDGEYLGWYSKNLTLENCKISGTQPFCYCQGLKLINCEMYNCDLAFEKSEVDADVTTTVDSIKNPYSGRIVVAGCNEIILDDEKANAIIIRR